MNKKKLIFKIFNNGCLLRVKENYLTKNFNIKFLNIKNSLHELDKKSRIKKYNI